MSSVASVVWSLVFAVVSLLRWFVTRTGLIVAAVVAAVTFLAFWRVVPIVVAHYELHDDAVRIARSPLSGTIESRLADAARQRGLARHIPEGCFRVAVGSTAVRISCDYRVPVELPGGASHELAFKLRVDEPVVSADAGTKFF